MKNPAHEGWLFQVTGNPQRIGGPFQTEDLDGANSCPWPPNPLWQMHSFVVPGDETVSRTLQELLCRGGKRELNQHRAGRTEEEGRVGGGHPAPRPAPQGEPGGRSLGRWGLRGAALPPCSAPTDPQPPVGPRGGGGSRALWPRRARRGLAGRGRAATATRRSGARGPPGRPACERSRGRPRSRLAGPSPGRRGRRAAAAGRRLPRRAGRSGAGVGGAGVRGPRTGMAGFRAEPPRPLPRRLAGSLCAPRWDSVSGAGLRRTKPQGADLGEIRRLTRGWGDSGRTPPPPGPGEPLGRSPGARSARVFPSQGPRCLPGTVLGAFPYLSPLRRPNAPSEGVMGGVPQSEAEGRASSHRCPPDLGKASLLRSWAAATVNGGTVEGVLRGSACSNTTPWYCCER